MKWIVKNDNGVLEFKSIQVCTESQFNKIMAGVNQQRILNWCDDNHVLAEVSKGQQHLSLLREVITEVNESEARRMDRLHTDFLKFIDGLPEVDIPENKDINKDSPIDTTVEKCLNVAKRILKGIKEGNVDRAVVVAEIGPISIPCGHISVSMLKELLEMYVEKYGNKN